MDSRSQTLLNEYLASLTPEHRRTYTSFSSDYFCADEHNAQVCAELIMKGEKRASCSMDIWYSQEGEPYPQVGHLQVVTDFHGNPKCIIEITEVTTCPFNQVTEEFAAAEGEGDKSHAWWRNAHWAFFSAECKELGIEMTEDTLLVLERFQTVYKADIEI
ncbi:ASCH domain-containing protein [Enterovibrio sp. ZSDZ35]|uniref:ASCH domain-containing protein n=1 Tax=Enterovibrio qingdaonensis TaxID=2899818 RepID=A0ABT5QGL2_9GAMM|nr:ASCH domain-containing protein [Enterovibrio sp. ZSDZ35]MDD1780115.1 ASCH domain-containing protein [Enterovibrio sp. ZSDZ35]